MRCYQATIGIFEDENIEKSEAESASILYLHLRSYAVDGLTNKNY